MLFHPKAPDIGFSPLCFVWPTYSRGCPPESWLQTPSTDLGRNSDALSSSHRPVSHSPIRRSGFFFFFYWDCPICRHVEDYRHFKNKRKERPCGKSALPGQEKQNHKAIWEPWGTNSHSQIPSGSLAGEPRDVAFITEYVDVYSQKAENSVQSVLG